jgi:hypothetical protein
MKMANVPPEVRAEFEKSLDDHETDLRRALDEHFAEIENEKNEEGE